MLEGDARISIPSVDWITACGEVITAFGLTRCSMLSRKSLITVGETGSASDRSRKAAAERAAVTSALAAVDRALSTTLFSELYAAVCFRSRKRYAPPRAPSNPRANTVLDTEKEEAGGVDARWTAGRACEKDGWL